MKLRLLPGLAFLAVMNGAVYPVPTEGDWVAKNFKFANGENGTEWSYDGDYSYKDKQTGRLVVMQAISKPSANIQPGGPGAGVGYVYALDCAKHNLIMVASYKPSAAFAIGE